jgi:hypothetical protein
MSKGTTTTVSIRLVLALTVTLAMLLSWTAVANAQRTSADVQYGSPTAAGEAAIASSGDPASAGYVGGTGTEGYVGGTGTEGYVGATGVLPATGGPLLQLAALGTLALASTGLLVLRHHSRR